MAQSEQAEEPGGAKAPAVHAVGTVAPAAHEEPAGQVVHERAFAVELNDPGAHWAHVPV